MDMEEYKKKCEEVEDTAYAEKGNPTAFGNELLLQNIDAFGVAISDMHHKVRALERAVEENERQILGLNNEVSLLHEEIENVKTHSHDKEEERQA
jgi:low affinity Fe/Cu permease